MCLKWKDVNFNQQANRFVDKMDCQIDSSDNLGLLHCDDLCHIHADRISVVRLLPERFAAIEGGNAD